MDHIWRLPHVLAVAEAGSVQGAARKLGLSQPALSKSLRVLETHLGTALFERSARGVVLTPMGEVFVRHAREIRQEWDGALIGLTATRDGARGELRIGVGPTYAVLFMRSLIARLAAQYPNLRIVVRTGVGAHLVPALQTGDISLYAGGLEPVSERRGEGLDELFLYDQSNSIVAARTSALAAAGGPVPLAVLADQPWVMLSDDSLGTEAVARLFRAANVRMPRSLTSTQSLGLALDLVRREGFLTSLPRPLLHPTINPDLAALPVPGYDWTIRTGVTYRASLRALAPVRAIIAMLEEEVRRLGFA